MFEISTNRGEILYSHGESLLESLQNSGIYLPASCGGKGICGRCKIRIVKGKIKADSFFSITEGQKAHGYVLACQSYPESDITIEIPEKLITVSERISGVYREIIEKPFKIEPTLLNPSVKKFHIKVNPPSINDSQADFERIKKTLPDNVFISRQILAELPGILREKKWQITATVAEGEIVDFTDSPLYGAAIDIGTTTIACALIDLEKGKLLETTTCYNSQITYGDDVITRIIYTEENPQGLTILRKCVVDDVNALVNALSVRHKEARIFYFCLAGNTTMMHIFWGINPEYIRKEPYTPVLNHYPLWRSRDAGLLSEQDVPVYTLPSVAGYVGGDIVAGVLASGMHREDEISLFIDIGTNGEIVIGNKQWFVTASTSAGPCFEGSGIKCGMRATEGALEAFKYFKESDRFEIKVIGGGIPAGICGSGMIDIVSELFSSGVIDRKGKLLKETSKWIKVFDEEPGFFITDNCYICQSDIDNIIRAKAAIYAGVFTLLKEIGITEKDVRKVYIAGGFGEFLDIKKAIRIGMLPNLPERKFYFLGNASLAGAILCLLSKDLREEAERIADTMTYIDLSRSKTFMDEYVSALFLPHTETERFERLSQ